MPFVLPAKKCCSCVLGSFLCNMRDLGTSVTWCLFCEVLMELSEILVVQMQEGVALVADPGSTVLHFYRHSLSVMRCSCGGPEQSKEGLVQTETRA